MASINWHIGHIVLILRNDRGWTQEQLGKKAGGLNKATIVSVEKMDRQHMNDTYARIARAFGLTLAQLFALVPGEETQRPTGTTDGPAGKPF
jgi:transcriptional regulator with XRE-family HTH domain